MAELKLNTTTSIVDFLKSQGKPSDFGSREGLYKSSGLETRLGKYTGSPSQNQAFLKSLSTPAAPVTPTQEPPVPTSQPNPAPPAPEAPATIGNSGLSAAQAAASIPQAPSADEVLQSVLNSAGFQNFKQQSNVANEIDIGDAAAKKAELESKAASDTKAFVDKMGQRGLFFSGETSTGIQALAESLAASKLGVDRKLAGELLTSDLKTQERIISDVEKVVKDAQNGRKEAIAALEKVGLTIIGDEIVPTLAAQREERQVQAEERMSATAEANRAAAERRLALSEEAATRAEAYLRLAEDRAAGGGSVTSGALTISNDQVGRGAQALNTARGADGWTDPNMYLELYNSWTSQGGLPQDFIKAFPPTSYINPQNKTLPVFLQNKPGSNTLIISPAAISNALETE